jgi:hypothetical protein
MFNIDKIVAQNDPYRNEVLKLHEFLNSKKGFIEVFSKKVSVPISIKTKFLEFATICKVTEMIENDITEKKKISPNWYYTLKAWVAELRVQLSIIDLDYPPEINKGSRLLSNEEIIFRRVFVAITHGNNNAIWEVGQLFLDFDHNTGEKVVVESYFNQIPRAIYYAYLLPKLIQDLKMYEDIELNSKADKIRTLSKIPWTGSPGEFGFILDLLIEKGYIDNVKGAKNKADFFLHFFSVKTSLGTIAAKRYIQDCFGKDKKSFLPHEFKLPPSEFMSN